MLRNVAGDSQGPVGAKKVVKPPLRHPTLRVKRDAAKLSSSPLSFLVEKLGILCLTGQFKHYLELNMTDSEGITDNKRVSAYRAHYCYTLLVPVVQFQGEGEVIHKLRWTGKENFRNTGRLRADWVWVHLRESAPGELQMGKLDRKTVGQLKGLLSVRDETHKVHEVALVVLL